MASKIASTAEIVRWVDELVKQAKAESYYDAFVRSHPSPAPIQAAFLAYCREKPGILRKASTYFQDVAAENRSKVLRVALSMPQDSNGDAALKASTQGFATWTLAAKHTVTPQKARRRPVVIDYAPTDSADDVTMSGKHLQVSRLGSTTRTMAKTRRRDDDETAASTATTTATTATTTRRRRRRRRFHERRRFLNEDEVSTHNSKMLKDELMRKAAAIYQPSAF